MHLGVSKMRLLTKISLGLAVVLISIAIAPAVKADPVTISSGGFHLSNLGNDGTGTPGMDSLTGIATSVTHNFNGAGSFIALLNPLTFTTGFTGLNSAGAHPFTFSQLLTINGQTQVLHLIGTIDISHFVDTVHISSAAPLTFTFKTFSVVVNMIPTDVEGFGGLSCGDLKAKITVVPNTSVPEPATLTLLGLGLAGAAAKLRKRRKKKIAA